MLTTPRASTNPSVRDSVGWLALALAVALPLYRPWIGIAAAVAALVWLLGPGRRERIASIAGNRLATAAVVFVAIQLVSISWSLDRAEGLREMGTSWHLLLVPILATTISRPFRRSAVIAFVAAAALAAAISLSIAAGAWNLGGADTGNPSPFMHHIDFSLLLAMASLITSVQLLYERESPGQRWAWALCGILVTTALFVNIGRSGHLAFAVGLAALAAYWSRGRRARAAAAAAVATAVVLSIVWMASPRLRDRTEAARTEIAAALAGTSYESSLGGRVAATEVAIELVARRPLLGTGIGGAMPAFREQLRSHHPEMEFAVAWYPHLHSQYLQTAVELGAIGLLSLGWVFWELLRRNPTRSATGAAAVVTAVVFAVGFVAEPFFAKPLTLVLFALFAGLIAAERN